MNKIELIEISDYMVSLISQDTEGYFKASKNGSDAYLAKRLEVDIVALDLLEKQTKECNNLVDIIAHDMKGVRGEYFAFIIYETPSVSLFKLLECKNLISPEDKLLIATSIAEGVK